MVFDLPFPRLLIDCGGLNAPISLAAEKGNIYLLRANTWAPTGMSLACLVQVGALAAFWARINNPWMVREFSGTRQAVLGGWVFASLGLLIFMFFFFMLLKQYKISSRLV